MDHIARYQGKRRLVEGSMRIQEIGVVPSEEIAFLTYDAPPPVTHTDTEA